MANPPKRPPFDPGYKNAHGFPNPDKTFDPSTLRHNMTLAGLDASSISKKHPQYQHTSLTIPSLSSSGSPPTTLALYQVPPTTEDQRKWPNGRPVILHIHGGGQIAGDRFFGLEFPMAHFTPSDGIVFASPEYRLAPEHPAPAGAVDVYTCLVYLAQHAEELGIDAEKIVLYGISGGAGIAASAALLGRREGGPRCKALVLDIPMLDDRQQLYASARQFREGTTWPGWMDERAWECVLGAEEGREDAEGVRVAGRVEDLSGLPVTFVDVGECEAMRDQAVAFASRIWRDGGSAELHVWPGVYHGGALFEPGVAVGQGMVKVQKGFLERVLGLGEYDVGGEEKSKAVL